MVLSRLSKQIGGLEIGREPHYYQEILNWQDKDLCKGTKHLSLYGFVL